MFPPASVIALIESPEQGLKCACTKSIRDESILVESKSLIHFKPIIHSSSKKQSNSDLNLKIEIGVLKLKTVFPALPSFLNLSVEVENPVPVSP